MLKKLAFVAFASLMVFQAGSALAETRVIVNGPDGVYVSDGRGDFGGHRWRDGLGDGDRRGDDWRGYRSPPPRVVIRERDRRDDYSAGIMGFLGGFAVGSALDNGGRIPVIRQPSDGFEPRPVGFRPWSPAWYQWCDSRYRSFDRRTGTFVDIGGRERFCEAG
jgi:hypothetical protein